MSTEIIVGIAAIGVAKAPDKITTIGLGSCVGISLYDKKNNIVGLAHIMLADSSKFTNKTNLHKYADTAIPILINEMEKLGCDKKDITAKIAGGAQMFKSADSKFKNDIGSRNVIATEEILSRNGIFIKGKDVGGDKGRTMIVDASTGIVTIRSLGKNVVEI